VEQKAEKDFKNCPNTKNGSETSRSGAFVYPALAFASVDLMVQRTLVSGY